MRKISDKFELGNVLQGAQPVLPKTVKVMINTERLRKWLRPEETGEKRRLNAMWYHRQEALEHKEDINGKTSEF